MNPPIRHHLVARLSASADRGAALKLVSILHRRAVDILELHVVAHTSGGRGGVFEAVFLATEQHASVVLAGFGNAIDVVEADLTRAVEPTVAWAQVAG